LKLKRTLQLGVILGMVLLGLPVRKAQARKQTRRPVTLEVVFHVADMNGRPVADEAFLDPQLERANQVFAPYGVTFAHGALRPLGSEHAVIEDAAGRDALGANVARGVINCFVVRRFRDVDDPSLLRRGVHWRSRTHKGAHFVILSVLTKEINVLAHELGHFLGNHGHSEVHGNLMSYDRGEELPVLDDKQRRRLRGELRRFLASREVRAFKPTVAGG
jgi:hypothetical protein